MTESTVEIHRDRLTVTLGINGRHLVQFNYQQHNREWRRVVTLDLAFYHCVKPCLTPHEVTEILLTQRGELVLETPYSQELYRHWQTELWPR